MHFPEHEYFLTLCPKSLLSVTANDFENGSEVRFLSTEGGAINSCTANDSNNSPSICQISEIKT